MLWELGRCRPEGSPLQGLQALSTHLCSTTQDPDGEGAQQGTLVSRGVYLCTRVGIPANTCRGERLTVKEARGGFPEPSAL